MVLTAVKVLGLLSFSAEASRPQHLVQKQGPVVDAMEAAKAPLVRNADVNDMGVAKAVKKEVPPTLTNALKDTWEQGIGTLATAGPLTDVVGDYLQWRTVFIMGMVLVAFGRIVMSSVLELKKALNALSKVETERLAAAENVTPMSARVFARSEGLAPLLQQQQQQPVGQAATRGGRAARPVAVQPEAGRRSHSASAAAAGQASNSSRREERRASSVGRH